MPAEPNKPKKRVVIRRNKKNFSEAKSLDEIPSAIEEFTSPGDLERKVFLALTKGQKIEVPRLPRGRPKSGGNKAAIIAEQKKVLYALHVRGLSVRKIEELTGIPYQTVQMRISDAIKDEVQPLAKEVLQLNLSRLESWITDMTPRIIAGDEKAVRAALAIMDRQAKFLGLDSAEKVDVSVTSTDAKTLALLNEARKKNADELKKIQSEQEDEDDAEDTE